MLGWQISFSKTDFFSFSWICFNFFTFPKFCPFFLLFSAFLFFYFINSNKSHFQLNSSNQIEIFLLDYFVFISFLYIFFTVIQVFIVKIKIKYISTHLNISFCLKNIYLFVTCIFCATKIEEKTRIRKNWITNKMFLVEENLNRVLLAVWSAQRCLWNKKN